MGKKNVIFSDPAGILDPVLAEITTETSDDPVEAFKKACGKARIKNKGCCYNYEIPGMYLQAHGVSMKIISGVETLMIWDLVRGCPRGYRGKRQCAVYKDGYCRETHNSCRY